MSVELNNISVRDPSTFLATNFGNSTGLCEGGRRLWISSHRAKLGPTPSIHQFEYFYIRQQKYRNIYGP